MPTGKACHSVLGLLVLAVVLASCQIPPQSGRMVVTTAAAVPDLGRAPEEIPADALEVIEMQPGHPGLNQVHSQFLSGLDGYRPGSGGVEAVYNGVDGELLILSWEEVDPVSGVVECRSAVSADAIPSGWSCDETSVKAHALDGYSHSSGPGDQMVMVEHSRDVEATVIELADGDSVVILPNGGPVSYHQWEGPSPVRFTIFWDDGTSTSEILSQ